MTPGEILETEAACQQLLDYVENTLDDRRRAPCSDFLSGFLVKAEGAGDLSPLEIIFQIVQLIIAGTDTTRVAIVMQIALLFTAQGAMGRGVSRPLSHSGRS
jgi:cytochrome P450